MMTQEEKIQQARKAGFQEAIEKISALGFDLARKRREWEKEFDERVRALVMDE